MLPPISGTGRLTDDPTLRFSPSGTAMAEVSIAFNSRKFNKASQEWEDGDVLFLRGTVFKETAEAVAESLTRGVEVVVTGRLRTRSWEDKDGGKRSVTELLIDSIGPALSGRQSAQVRKTTRDGGSSGGGRSLPADDPWSTGAASPEEPPF